MRFLALLIGGLFAFAGTSWAQVTVKPTESVPNDTQMYTVRVQSEAASPTVSLDRLAPPEVLVLPMKGMSYEIKQSEGRSVVSWKLNISPGKTTELQFVAKNPERIAEIVWKFSQGYADGSKTAWNDPSGGKQLVSVTKLVAAEYMSPL